VRKIFLVLTGILMFYVVRIFFKRIKRSVERQSYGSGGREPETVLTGGKGRSFNTDRVIEEADYTEIDGDSGK